MKSINEANNYGRKLINEVQGVNAERIAKELYDAMDGPGTDENKFFTAIQPTGRQGLTTDEMNAVKTAYKNLYDEDLCNRLPGDFGGNELRKAQEALGCTGIDSLNESTSLDEQRKVLKVDVPTPEPEGDDVEDMDMDMDMGDGCRR